MAAVRSARWPGEEAASSPALRSAEPAGAGGSRGGCGLSARPPPGNALWPLGRADQGAT